MNKKAISAARMFIVATLMLGSLTTLGVERLQAAPVQGIAKSAQAVNVNTAGVEELQMVRGIGPSLAKRIIAYREENGSFEQVEDLIQVRGIGPSKLDAINDQLTV